MSCSRSKFPIAAPLALACILASSGAFAQETAPAGGLSVSSEACAAETWPNISAACAGTKTVRKVRVISLDKEAPTTVPVPASVQAAYASKQADAKPVQARDTKAARNQEAASPMPKLEEDGTIAGIGDGLSSAASAEPVKAENKAAAAGRRQTSPKKVARAQRRAQERYAAQYGDEVSPYVAGYGYEAQPRWRSSRTDDTSARWFSDF